MSNCITLHQHRVKFTAEEMDTTKLVEDLSRHIGHDGRCRERSDDHRVELTDEGELCEMERWFVSPAANLYPQRIVPTTIEILFGEGGSTHTWRDFRWMVAFIGKYMKKPKLHTFLVADESDSFETVGRMDVEFGGRGILGD